MPPPPKPSVNDPVTHSASRTSSIRPDDEPSGTGSGYVVDCLRSARLALQQPTYELVVRAAIRLGNDTDTTACIAGGLAGLRDGYQSIPARWRNALRGQDLVEPLLRGLLAQAPIP